MTSQLCNKDEGRVCRKAEFSAVFLRLRRKLKDFNKIAGWGPVQAYNIQPGLMDLTLLKNFLFP